MKWNDDRQSENIEDRRGMSGGGKAIAGGGIIGIVILLLQVFGGQTGQAVGNILQQTQGQQTEQTQTSAPLTEKDVIEGKNVSSIVVHLEEVWAKIFQEQNMQFEAPKLVMFRDQVETACGSASSASGPFYCPGDRKIYLDMAFFEELRTKFGSEGGDFAVAYVIAHEYGHHIQNLLGTSDKMRQAQEGKSEAEANKLSVALELQADFYAGVWTNYSEKTNHMLEPGDIEEALSAANAVGDDAIQSKMQGQVVPDSFTHGSSEKRMYWFTKGFKTGDMNQGTTFDEI